MGPADSRMSARKLHRLDVRQCIDLCAKRSDCDPSNRLSWFAGTTARLRTTDYRSIELPSPVRHERQSDPDRFSKRPAVRHGVSTLTTRSSRAISAAVFGKLVSRPDTSRSARFAQVVRGTRRSLSRTSGCNAKNSRRFPNNPALVAHSGIDRLRDRSDAYGFPTTQSQSAAVAGDRQQLVLLTDKLFVGLPDRDRIARDRVYPTLSANGRLMVGM